MAFWQENYAFIKDVYDTRASKLDELMVKTDNAIKDVKADKLYTSAEFKKVKEIFAVGILQHYAPKTFKMWSYGCLCWNLTILLPLRFYMKSNVGEFKRSKKSFLAILEVPNFDFRKF